MLINPFPVNILRAMQSLVVAETEENEFAKQNFRLLFQKHHWSTHTEVKISAQFLWQMNI